MIVTRDFRGGRPEVTIQTTLTDFRELVEWLELLDPNDGCTREFREHLDRIYAPEEDE